MRHYRNELRNWRRPGTVSDVLAADLNRNILARWWRRIRSPLPFFWAQVPPPNWACSRRRPGGGYW